MTLASSDAEICEWRCVEKMLAFVWLESTKGSMLESTLKAYSTNGRATTIAQAHFCHWPHLLLTAPANNYVTNNIVYEGTCPSG